MIFKHHLFHHQNLNAPAAIHTRNKNILEEEQRLAKERENNSKKFKRFNHEYTYQAMSKNNYLNEEAAAELGEEAIVTNYAQSRIKFVPKPPSPKGFNPSPLGKMHVSTPKLAPLVVNSINIFLLLFPFNYFAF